MTQVGSELARKAQRRGLTPPSDFPSGTSLLLPTLSLTSRLRSGYDLFHGVV